MADQHEWIERLIDTKVTYHVEIDGQIVVVENVPARTNVETGQDYFSAETVERLERIIHDRCQPHRTIEIPVYEFESSCERMAVAAG